MSGYSLFVYVQRVLLFLLYYVSSEIQHSVVVALGLCSRSQQPRYSLFLRSWGSLLYRGNRALGTDPHAHTRGLETEIPQVELRFNLAITGDTAVTAAIEQDGHLPFHPSYTIPLNITVGVDRGP